MARDTIESQPPQSPDALTEHSEEAGVWGLPSTEGVSGEHDAQLPHLPGQYAGGIFVGAGYDANAQDALADHLIPARVDTPRAFELPHEATHRRYEAPRMFPIAQSAAGTTMLVPAQGLHYVKIIAAMITLDAEGTIQFVQGANDGVGTLGAMSGAMNLGGSSAPGFILPPASIPNPWLFTNGDLSFGIKTTTGKANGWVVACYSPYDQ